MNHRTVILIASAAVALAVIITIAVLAAPSAQCRQLSSRASGLQRQIAAAVNAAGGDPLYIPLSKQAALQQVYSAMSKAGCH